MVENNPSDESVVQFHGRVAIDLHVPELLRRITASVLDPSTGEVISQVGVQTDGSLRGALPLHLRGKKLEVVLNQTVADSTEEVARLPIKVPAAGDALFQIPAAVGIDQALGVSSRILTPGLLKARIAEKARYADELAEARRQAFSEILAVKDGQPETQTLFKKHVESLFHPKLKVPKETSLHEFILKHPVIDMGLAPNGQRARLRLTKEEQASLGKNPILCDALGARAHRYGLRRKPRLSERLETGLRTEALSLPKTTPTPAAPTPAAGPKATVEELAHEAEKVVLAKTASVVSDLVPRPGEPTTGSDVKRLHDLAEDLELARGAANVSAAKDVHVLQLAYQTPLERKYGNELRMAFNKLDQLHPELERATGIELPILRRTARTSEELSDLVDDSLRLVQRAMQLEEPPQAVGQAFPMVNATAWGRLSDESRLTLSAQALAGTAAPPSGTMQTMSIETDTPFLPSPSSSSPSSPVVSLLGGIFVGLLSGGTDFSPQAPYAPLDPSVLARTELTLFELRNRLRESYEFDTYAPESVNYGLMLTYRQEWSPVRYQVGRLIDTIPLTPGEKREVKVVTTRKTHDARSSLTNQTRESTSESTSTTRLESEAIEAATMAVNNQFSANGSFNIGVGSIGGSAEFKLNTNEESRRTLKNFSELTRKAVDTLKNQVEVKVESSEDFSSEVTDLRTITNANNEITVTFLLYELERRYRVDTHLAAVRPVVLYALKVPAPDEIDAAWILEYSDQIRKFLLDPTLRPVLDDLEQSRSSADLDFRLALSRLNEQRGIYQRLTTEIDKLEAQAAQHTTDAGNASVQAAAAKANEPSTGQAIGSFLLGNPIPLLSGGSSVDETLEAQARADEKQAQAVNRQLDTTRASLVAAAGAISAAYENYQVKALARSRCQLAETRLAVHIRDNIFHYMHGIWSSTHPDNRYFEHHSKKVPFHNPKRADYTLTNPSAPSVIGPLPGIDMLGEDKVLTIKKPALDATVDRYLSEIADIDRPLGFRGNFIVFELRECSQLTDYMAAEFVDPDTGVAIPGLITGLSTTELLDYLEAAVAHSLVTEKQLDELKDLVRRISHEQSDWADDIVLPTGQVMLEALKGETTLLEPFKLVHRGIDVIAAEEDVRAKRLDALRRARKVATADLERDPTSVERFFLGEEPDVDHV